MASKFFKDESFINELIQDFERVDAISEAEKRDPLEILSIEYQGLLDDIDRILSASDFDIKKSKMREKTGIWSSIEVVLHTAEKFKANWGFSVRI